MRVGGRPTCGREEPDSRSAARFPVTTETATAARREFWLCPCVATRHPPHDVEGRQTRAAERDPAAQEESRAAAATEAARAEIIHAVSRKESCALQLSTFLSRGPFRQTSQRSLRAPVGFTPDPSFLGQKVVEEGEEGVWSTVGDTSPVLPRSRSRSNLSLRI